MRFGIISVPRTVESTVAEATLVEALGFDWFGVIDSQSVYREVYATLALCAHATNHIRIGPTVSNPVTRHPAVSAAAMATLGEIARGRAIFALSSGDSAVLNLGERPARMAEMREYLAAVRGLLDTGVAGYRGKQLHMSWPGHAIPLYMAAEGPKTLELAGEIADGVIVNLGLHESLIHDAVERIHAGAATAGRDPDELDIWTMVRVNVCDDVEAGLDEIKMELASSAHHVFRFTLEGKGVPADMVAAIERVQRGYRPGAHEQIGGPNAALVEERALLEYLSDRFAVLGTPEQCAARLRRVADAGIANVLFTGFVRDRTSLIRSLGEKVIPLLGPSHARRDRL
jgi:5,10-methylenetetrahydromethanopterin reductase